jgi:hypothetical protein
MHSLENTDQKRPLCGRAKKIHQIIFPLFGAAFSCSVLDFGSLLDYSVARVIAGSLPSQKCDVFF